MTLTPEDLIRIRGEEADIVTRSDLVASINDAHRLLKKVMAELTTAGRKLDSAVVAAEGLSNYDAQADLRRTTATVAVVRRLTILTLEDLEHVDY
jgi:hypothetical protein